MDLVQTSTMFNHKLTPRESTWFDIDEPRCSCDGFASIGINWCKHLAAVGLLIDSLDQILWNDQGIEGEGDVGPDTPQYVPKDFLGIIN